MAGGFRRGTIDLHAVYWRRRRPIVRECAVGALAAIPMIYRESYLLYARDGRLCGDLTRAICGHLTEEMTERYSSVGVVGKTDSTPTTLPASPSQPVATT